MSFTREEAKEFACKVIDEIYDHNPKAFRLEIEAAVDIIPNYKISYGSYIKLGTYQPEDMEYGERKMVLDEAVDGEGKDGNVKEGEPE